MSEEILRDEDGLLIESQPLDTTVNHEEPVLSIEDTTEELANSTEGEEVFIKIDQIFQTLKNSILSGGTEEMNKQEKHIEVAKAKVLFLLK